MVEKNTNMPGEQGMRPSQSGPKRKRIGQQLVEADLITQAQLEEALRLQSAQGGRIVEILISLGYLDAGTFTRFLARQPGIPSINLQHYEVPWEMLTLVPREFAVNNEVFPLDRMGNLLTLAMVCPLDTETIQKLETQTGLRIKPLLCAPADVRAAIQRYYQRQPMELDVEYQANEEVAGSEDAEELAAPMRLSSVGHMVRQIQYLPGLPETVHRVREAMADPEASVKEVAGVVSGDPPIAGKVLSVANSPAYGFHQRVVEVGHAVSLLGLRETYAIVAAATVIEMFDESDSFDYRAFWRTSLYCAAAAAVFANASAMAKHIRGGFAAGLLHDIGRIVFAEVAPDRYARVGFSLQGEALLEAEQEVMGLTHAEAGHELAQHWELPLEIANAIRFHHRPEDADANSELAAVIGLASIVADADNAGTPLTGELYAGRETWLEIAGIKPREVNGLLNEYLTQKEGVRAAGIIS